MKFFTREWADGQLPDEVADSVLEAYERHLDRLRPTLPPAALKLIHVDLHDALFASAVVSSNRREVRLHLVGGDLQVGYFDAHLIYSLVDFDSFDVAALRAVVEHRSSELLYDELDTDPDGLILHSMLFAPVGEIEVRCHDVEVGVNPRESFSDRSVPVLPRRIVEE